MKAFIVLGASVAWLFARAFGSLIEQEASAWCPRIARAIANRGATRVGREAPRYREEFAADLAQFQDRPFSMLIVAVRIYFSTFSLSWALRTRLRRQPSRFEEWVFQRGTRSRAFRLWYYALAPVPLMLVTALSHEVRAPNLIQLLPLVGTATLWVLGATVEAKVLLRRTQR